MIPLLDWLDRRWTFEVQPGVFPAVLERLRGTPARADELVAGVNDRVLAQRTGSAWSIKEHIGHLDDLHGLDVQRVDEFLRRAATLSAADMGNRRTEDAGHRETPVREILARFRTRRLSLVDRLETLAEDDVTASAMHPRLKRAVRLIDWAQFVAEHDDHHLASARALLRQAAAATTLAGAS
jgi:DinB family protein